MIAFIGVRISWLIAARNVRLGLVGRPRPRGAPRGPPCRTGRSRSRSSPAGRGPTKNDRSASVNGRAGDWRQTAIMPMTVSRAMQRRDHQPLLVVRLGPGDRDARADPPSTLFTISGRRAGGRAADDALARAGSTSAAISSAIAPRATIARNDRPSGSARYTALVSPSSRSTTPLGHPLQHRRQVERRRDLAGRRRPAPPSRRRAAGPRDTAARSGSRCRRWPRSSRAAARPPGRTGPRRSMLWTLITPIAPSPTRIGTPRYDLTGVPTHVDARTPRSPRPRLSSSGSRVRMMCDVRPWPYGMPVLRRGTPLSL